MPERDPRLESVAELTSAEMDARSASTCWSRAAAGVGLAAMFIASGLLESQRLIKGIINAEKNAGKKSEEKSEDRKGGRELTVSRRGWRFLATDCSVGGDGGGGCGGRGRRRWWKTREAPLNRSVFVLLVLDFQKIVGSELRHSLYTHNPRG